MPWPARFGCSFHAMQRKGDAMMAKWAEVMTGMQSKTYFLQPHIAVPMAWSVIREFFEQYVLLKPDKYYART